LPRLAAAQSAADSVGGLFVLSLKFIFKGEVQNGKETGTKEKH
jgi:hypothetical protein